MKGLRVIAYGGGVQSSAMVVLAVQGRIPGIDAALFANVGDDSEHPATLEYVRDVMQPWAGEHGLPVHELHKVKRDGTVETLWGQLMRDGSRSLPIPVRMADTGAPGTRSCTGDYKIKVIGRWLRANGATRVEPAAVCIGFSTDEVERVGNRRTVPYETVTYPLLELGLSRQDCAKVIEHAGLPVPPKSACYFCPFHRPATWAEMRRDTPELFARSVLLERTLIARRAELGKDPVYLTRFGRPLDEAIREAQPTLTAAGIGEGGCDDGFCWT